MEENKTGTNKLAERIVADAKAIADDILSKANADAMAYSADCMQKLNAKREELEQKRRSLVQGVIDCAFLEGGDWILLDYKTDRIEDPEAFCDEYRPQLAWYAAALETLTGRKVREKCLYALSTGQVFPV